MDKDTILGKVRKMMALANDDAAHEGEVENALKMARALMTAYGISDEDLFEGDGTTTSIGMQSAAEKAGFASWEQHLSAAIAAVCDCRATIGTRTRFGPQGKKRRKHVNFTGFEHDVAVACPLFVATAITIRTMARQRFGTGWGIDHRSYAEGFVVGLQRKAQAWLHEAQATNAIVLRKDLAVKEWMDENLNVGIRVRTQQSKINVYAMDQGRKDGSRIVLKERLGDGATVKGALT